MRNTVRFFRFAGVGAVMQLFLLQAHGQYAYTSNRTITGTGINREIAPEKQTLLSVLKDLNRVKGFYFLYSEESIGKRLVDPVKDVQVNIEAILSTLLDETGLTYKKVSSNTYVIIPEGEKMKSRKELKALNFSTRTVAIVPDPVKGRVVSAEGTPLSGVSITVKGTKRGTTTNSNGEFVLDVTRGETLIVSSIGYASQEFVVGDSHELSISLSATAAQISEVVVTALGIRKERRSLGYSVTEVKGSELTQAREVNVANSLVGRVAGVNVNSVSGGPGSSASIIIRGISSLTGDNQPLYVINGIPMTNKTRGNDGGQYTNAPDLGDGIQNINPDDIESISVLKGAAASALYGSRAKAGVILITTKSGSGKGTIEFNSNFVTDHVIDPTDWQYEYGNGANGLKPTTAAAAYDAGNSSWGAKLDGSNVIQFDGVSRPYVAQKNNIENFYRNGKTFTNTVSFSRGFEGGAFRFSASNLHSTSPVPNSGLNRYNFNMAFNFNVTKRLTIDARANYISDKAENRPILADGAGNANFQVMFLPTSLDVNTLKPGTKADGSEMSFTNNAYATNPYFASYKFINNTLRNRLIGSVTARYTFENGLFGQIRLGRDFVYDRYTTVVPNGAAYYGQAFRNIGEQYARNAELNADFLIGKTFRLGNDISLTPNIGGNIMKARDEVTEESGSSFAVPYVYTILNAKNKSISYTDARQEIQSLYATLEFNYKNLLYLNASGRNDWFSILAPSKNLDIFYPSISGSFVFTEMWKPSWLSFGKLRAGWANVGSASSIGPYQTLLNYGLFGQQLNGLPLGNITNSSIPNNELKPSNARELEIGTEFRLMNGRIGVDLTWYNKKSENEIVPAPASITSGYTGVVLNIGELENKGWEALVSANILHSAGLNWTSSINGSINKNKVLSLSEGQSQLGVATSRTGTGFTRNIVGLPVSQVMAFDYKYDASGKVVLLASGIPAQGDLVPWGSAYHKWTAGWNNEFVIKGVNFSFLIDGKFGGKVFSATDYYGYLFGLHKNTLPGREGTFGPSNLSAQNYYGPLASNVSKMFVYDASFIKFRQFVLGYTFRTPVLKNVIQSANVSLVGRNLFILMKKTDNIDPEASYSGRTQGLELGGVPPVRSYGINLNLKF